MKDYPNDLAFFLLEHTGSVLGRWRGKMLKKDQINLFGRFIGKGTIIIDGSQEIIFNRVKVAFGNDWDDRNVTLWKDL